MATTDRSWELGPENVRPVRVLMYLAEGIFGGFLLYLLVSFARSLLPDVLAGEIWAIGLAGLFVLLYARWLWYWKVFRPGSRPGDWVMHDWLEVQQWRWPAILVALIGGGLVAASVRYPSWFLVNDMVVPSVAWLTALVLFGAASLLLSKGRIDAESLTLTTLRYGTWRDVDLRTVTGVKRVRLGPYTILWLSVSPGVDKRVTIQGFYTIPTTVVQRTWAAFEAGIDAEVPLDAAAVERSRSLRRVNRAVALLFVILGFAAVIWMVSLEWQFRDAASLWPLVVLIWALAGGTLFFLKLSL